MVPEEPDELAELERRRQELYRELGQVGDFRRGSLNEVRRKCGKPNCACAAPDHLGHGPQYNCHILAELGDEALAGVHARRPQGRMARRPPGRPGLRRHRRHLPCRPRLPAPRRRERRAGHRSGLLREQRPTCATTGFAGAACSPAPASWKPAGRRSSASASSRLAYTEPSTGPRHHRPALPPGQQHLGSHLQQSPHSNALRLTRDAPKMILTTDKIDAHPAHQPQYEHQ
jgi:hypothetical protein